MTRLISYLILTTVLSFTCQVAFAQEENPIPWCRQNSDVGLEVSGYGGYRWVNRLGNGPNGVRPMYQEYNHRIILMTSDTREVVQLVEENIDTSSFRLLGYSPDCRFMAGALGKHPERIETVIWDLSTHPATRLGSFEDGVNRPHQLDWSPNGQYVVVGTRNASYLWNLQGNILTELAADSVSDCYRTHVGCNGALVAHSGLRWDMDNGTLSINLNRVPYTILFDLQSGQLINTTDWAGSPVSEAVAQTVAARVDPPYGCVPRVHYQTYNQRLVLKDWITGELIEVIEDNLVLIGYQFLGWSATYQYIAAAIDDGSGIQLVAWNIATHARTMTPISDYVDKSTWAATDNTLSVRTDGEGDFYWNIDTNQVIPRTDTNN